MQRSTLRTLVVSLVAATASDGCSGGCSNPFTPLPAPVPPTQIVEGGIQVRITKSGLAPVTAALKTAVNATLGGSGVCIPGETHVDPGTVFPFVDICYSKNDCGGGEMGCKLNVSVNDASLAPSDTNTLHADVNINGQASVPIHAYYDNPFHIDVATCTFVGKVTNSHIVADVDVGIDATSGEITLHLGQVDVLDINPDISSPDCPITADILGAVSDIAFDLFATNIGNLIVNLLTPTLDGLVQGILPKPLGLDGLLDVGSFLDSIAPGTSAKIEVHGVPGGYASLPAGGISVGVNIGLNADRNPATRGPTNSSEPALCVPQWTAPDLSAPPASLPKTTRGTFQLHAAGAFLGNPDPPGDVAIGVSQTVLDLAGHHVTSAGTLCLSIGTSLVPQLNLGTVGIIVKSLAALGQGKEPLLLALRPTAPINFDIGDGTDASPFLTAHLKDFEIDFYALIFERYVRAFTVGASVDLGVNLVFMKDKTGQPVVVPTLVGLDTSKIKVTVTNTEFLRETPDQLAAAFPTLLDFVLPLLSSSLPDIPVPTIEGFTLGSLTLKHISAPEDEFLAIYASLATPAPGKLAEPDARATTTARVVRVSAPPPEQIRAALAGDPTGALPEIELALGGTAPDGQAALEWQWNLDGGMWRPFISDAHYVIRDRGLAIEGKHTVNVRARALGDYETTDVDGVSLDVIVDSVAPHIDPTSLVRVGDDAIVTVTDAVSDDAALVYALSAPAATAPATAWTPSNGHLSMADVERLEVGGTVKLYVRDEAGNVATSLLGVSALFGASAPLAETGGCSVGGGSGGDGLVGLLVVLGFVAARRRRPWLLALLLPACASSKLGPVMMPECTMDADCASMCTTGMVGQCQTDMTCTCVADIPIGTIGTFTNLAVSAAGVGWISAYNTTYGDLVVAQAPMTGRVADTSWEFADGVPAGPVAIPASHIRGGIRAAGDDVGLYTSIALTASGDPVVAYYDRTHAGLRFAQRTAGKWTSYALDTGVPGTKDVGRYTAVTVDSMGRPAIAYLALVADAPDGSGHSEVRYVSAAKAQPAQADWTQVLVESKAMPAPNTMIDDVPEACGLFIAATRAADGHAFVVYYDRPAGELMLAEQDAAAGVFKKPVVLDGGNGQDAGWYPSLSVSPDGVLHVAYVDAEHQNLLVTTYPNGTPVVADDGYRTDGTTDGGEPRPVYHHVGDNSAIVDNGTIHAVVYQDATTQDLLMAVPAAPGMLWTHTKIAGSDQPYKGAYGFYAAAALAGGNLVMSSFALNQMTGDEWVEVFRQKMQ